MYEYKVTNCVLFKYKYYAHIFIFLIHFSSLCSVAYSTFAICMHRHILFLHTFSEVLKQ